MPGADFFGRLGLFVARGFFDGQTCASLRSELRTCQVRPATLTQKGTHLVDETTRRTKSVKVSAPTLALVRERLLALKPDLERHFGEALTGCEKPQFLRYGVGDFFETHQDSNTDPEAADYIRARRVSVVIFLNGQAGENVPDSHEGGSLSFYGLFKDPRAGSLGFPLAHEAGLLVAFRSDVTHAVEPVTRGERFTVVTWFF